jgi:acetylornithine deacetylase/succinyl-diaminopimelate desuccinylase-like protein
MTRLPFFQQWFQKNKQAIEKDYFDFLRFRSISTEPAFKKEVDRCAEWVSSYLEQSGFDSRLVETPVHPVVVAENSHAGPERPTLLIYGHYDVQPVDPIELWISDPFTPTVREGKIFARGAVDDKGQIFYAMVAMRAWKEKGEPLPINIKFCIEGEEEASSLGLSNILPKIEKSLRADHLLVVDYDAYDENVPAINLGARGMLSMDVSIQGATGDLHSGLYGGIAYNPNRALAELLAKLYDEEGRVTVEGFYEDVKAPTEQERKTFPARYDRAFFTKHFGIEAFGGEKGSTIQEANLFRPVLEINGMAGGYFGPGFKTVIPAKAIAKLSCRLVPGQDPKKIAMAIRSFLEKHCPHGMKLQVDLHLASRAYRGNPDSALSRAVAAASEEVTGHSCRKVLSGASVPIVEPLVRATRAEVVGMGYGLPTDQIHAPNEHFDMRRFEKGFLTVAQAIGML